ncbi:MAG: amidase [Planctomycetes bacterium]|nr:amidase [Planctomycetota bacterium]
MKTNAALYLDGSMREAAEAIRTEIISTEELIHAAIERIETAPGAKACFVRFRPEEALRATEQLGREETKKKSPLFGIPMAHKDLFSVENDQATFCAHREFQKTGKETALALAALNKAGAINLGGVHMAEFAMGAGGWNETYGFLSNPHDSERVSGGSSSGSAAAVARRLVFASLGTDTGGSARIPACFFGVDGF